jgi:hypothetical protein
MRTFDAPAFGVFEVTEFAVTVEEEKVPGADITMNPAFSVHKLQGFAR